MVTLPFKVIPRLPLPGFYNPRLVQIPGYQPDPNLLRKGAFATRKKHRIKPSAADPVKIYMVTIDGANHFCREGGALFVGNSMTGGPLGDCIRLTEWGYRYLPIISGSIFSTDAHSTHQISTPAATFNRDGEPVEPNTLITAEAMENGDFRANPDVVHMLKGGRTKKWLDKYRVHYSRELARTGKQPLFVWNEHCPVGGEGQAIVNILQEMRWFHAYARGHESWTHFKGRPLLTEAYSAVRPEVLFDHEGRPLTESDPNMAAELAANAYLLMHLLQILMEGGIIVVAGWASSHCVSSTLMTLLEEILKINPELAKQVYVLTDCTSPVVVRDPVGKVIIDFTPNAETQMAKLYEAGMNPVQTTTPIEEWPGIKLAA